MVLSLAQKKSLKDDLFRNRKSQGDFVFNEQVADVFEDMAVRSIPGYETIVSTIGGFAKKYYKLKRSFYGIFEQRLERRQLTIKRSQIVARKFAHTFSFDRALFESGRLRQVCTALQASGDRG